MRNLNVFVWIFALTIIIYSFIQNPTTESILGFEVNIWIYRLVWGIIAALSILEQYKMIRTNRSKSK